MPTTLLLAPPGIFRPSYGPGLAVPVFALHTYFVLYVCSLQHLSHMKILLMVSKSKSICHQNDFLAWRFAIITSSLLHLQDRRNWWGVRGAKESRGPRDFRAVRAICSHYLEAKPPLSNELSTVHPLPFMDLPPVLMSKYVLTWCSNSAVLRCFPFARNRVKEGMRRRK